MKFSILNFQFSIKFFFLLIIFYLLSFTIKTALAVNKAACSVGTPERTTGFVTASDFASGSKFYTSSSGGCLVDSTTIFAPFKIPTFADWEVKFYDRSKFPSKATSLSSWNFTQSGLYKITGNLTANTKPTGSGTQVIFVKGNLNITTKNLDYHPNDALGGLIFIVEKDINIDQSVQTIDALLISFGSICTAHNGTSCPTNFFQTSQLLINGSLISLNTQDPNALKFRRTLSNNNSPAERVNYQPKYLALLKDFLAEPLSITTADSQFNIGLASPTPGPSSSPSPSSTPSLDYRRVFATSTKFNGDLKSMVVGATSGLEAADQLCKGSADGAGLGTSSVWQAWLSDSSADPSSHFVTKFSGDYKLVDGTTIIANSWTDLTDDNIDNKINRDEFGALFSKKQKVWTNTNPQGGVKYSNTNHCSNWTSSSSGFQARAGSTNDLSNDWSSETNNNCSNFFRLYCFEQSGLFSPTPSPSPSSSAAPIAFVTQPTATDNSNHISATVTFTVSPGCPTQTSYFYKKTVDPLPFIGPQTPASPNCTLQTGTTYQHTGTLSGLQDKTNYQYYVVISDSVGNSATSVTGTFKTGGDE